MNIIEDAVLPAPDHGARAIEEGRQVRVIDFEGGPIGEYVCFRANTLGERFSQAHARVTRRKLPIAGGNRRYAPGTGERAARGVVHVPERQG